MIKETRILSALPETHRCSGLGEVLPKVAKKAAVKVYIKGSTFFDPCLEKVLLFSGKGTAFLEKGVALFFSHFTL